MSEQRPTFIVQLTTDELRQIIEEAVKSALQQKQPAKLQYSLDEAARRLNVKSSLLSAKIKGEHPLPHHRMGRRIYFTEQDLALIDQITAASGANNGKN